MSKAEDYTHVGATNDIKEISKAEKAARKVYPHYTAENITEVTNARHFFAKGYEQAEKDLGLTWEDVKRIVEIADKLCPYTSKEMAEFQENFQTEEAYYKEVLKQFNDGGKENTKRD